MARLEEKIEKAILPLIKMYEEIENDLLIKIASHFLHTGEFLNSDYWRIKKLDEMGFFNQEIIQYIAKYSNKTEEEILKALNQIEIDTLNFNNLNRLFEDGILKVNPRILSENYTIKNIINSAYNELSNRFIQMSRQIEESTRNAYLDIVEKAYLETTMGTHSYQESIRNAIDNLGNKGLTLLEYKITNDADDVIGIRHYDISSTVRREVLTASRQLSNNINMEIANELECEYLYLSEHIRCRPQHFDWQGTIIKREDLVPVTDYGSITGLAGINCAHYFEPYFGKARGNDLKIISKQEATKQYNLSQRQRYLERGVRKWKRKAEMFKANEDIDAYRKSRSKVKEWQLKVKNFTEENNLKRDYTREYVKETSPFKISNFKDVTQEWLENATPDSHVVQDMNYFETHDGIKYYVDGKSVVLDYSLEEKNVADWLENTFGGEIYMVPRVNNPDSISTPDYLFRGEKYDLKEITGSSTRIIDNAIKGKQKQAMNFILDITNSKSSKAELLKQAKAIYNSKGRVWVNRIIMKKYDELIVILERKKRD